MSEIIRTIRDGCFQVRTNAWGSFLAPCPDPDSTIELEKGALDRFELHDDIHKIPADLWQRWIQLCFHFAHLKQGDLEVSCRLLRHEDDRSKWRILVPRQEVSGASVRIDSFDQAVDIETGELIETYPPEGWIPAGSSHSHNTMPMAKFSGIDDASELGCPGLHIVISHINNSKRTYIPTASVTANHRRFYLDKAALVVDLEPVDTTYHPNVLTVVLPERPRYTNQGVWLPGHLSRAEMDAYGYNYADGYYGSYGKSTSSVRPTQQRKRSDLTSGSLPTKDRIKQLAEFGETPEDLIKDSLHSLWEQLDEIRAICIEYGVDPDETRNTVMDAVNFTFDPDDDTLWQQDDTDHSAGSAGGHHPPTTAALPASDW